MSARWSGHQVVASLLVTTRCGRIGPCDGKGTASHSNLSWLVAASVRRGVGYYRRNWLRMLVGLLGMVRYGFALGPLGNLKAAWHVLRGSQAWAPFPDNDPEAARHHMARFFRMANGPAGPRRSTPRRRTGGGRWQTHRAMQHDAQVGEDDLVAAMVRSIATSTRRTGRRAPRGRAEGCAMVLSDAWVAVGCQLDDLTLAKERLAPWPCRAPGKRATVVR